jgi:hypothetical protein
MSTEECEKKAAWFHAGIIQGTSCTVSSYYLPNGDLEKTEIDVEVYCLIKSVSQSFLTPDPED